MKVVESADYVVVGGGLTGLTLASRLSKEAPNSTVLVVEAGGDPRSNPDIQSFAGLLNLQSPDCPQNWNFDEVPSSRLNDRKLGCAAGKGLGGSGNLNAGIWLRGNAADYDAWAEVVGDEAWSYEGMLPYLKAVESIQYDCKDRQQHGFDGYVKVSQVSDKSYRKGSPIQEPLRQAFAQAGVTHVEDPNAGSQNGYHDHFDAWYYGKRQLLLDVLDLSRVKIQTDTLVHRICLETASQTTTDETNADNAVAAGIDIGDGKMIRAKREVIVAAGAYQTPKLLLLSGIGDPAALSALGIATRSPLPEVGRNLADHLGMCVQWKVLHPEKGVALGSPHFSDPSYYYGYPVDLVYHGAAADSKALGALIQNPADREVMLRPGRSNFEVYIQSLPMGPEARAMGLVPNGEYISSISICVSPASRGCVRLRSADPTETALIDRAFNEHAADLYIHREALRTVARALLETDAGRGIVECEVFPDGAPAVTSTSSDAELDRRIAGGTFSISHPMGTAAMGKVVDGRCRVIGVKGLRCIDASVLPFPHGAPLQPLLFALAEKMAHFIASGE